jgi:hypothetical protein
MNRKGTAQWPNLEKFVATMVNQVQDSRQLDNGMFIVWEAMVQYEAKEKICPECNIIAGETQLPIKLQGSSHETSLNFDMVSNQTLDIKDTKSV